MSAEMHGNLAPLLDYMGQQSLAAEVNTMPQRWDIAAGLEPYATFYRAMLVSPVDSQVYDNTVRDFAMVEPNLRYSVLARVIDGLEDETIVRQGDKLLQLVESANNEDTAEAVTQTEEKPSIRSQFDRAVVLDRLQRTGLVSGFVLDQDYFLEEVINTENNFVVGFDELLSLEASYDPNKKSKEEMIAVFNQWANDPEGGQKIVRGEGLACLQKDLAMGYDRGQHDGQGVSEAEASRKIDDYLRTNSYELMTAYVEDLLFKRSPVGLQLVEKLGAQGFQGMLFEGSEQMARAYGIALAANGHIQKAEAVALGTRINYEDYAYIHVEIARAHRKNGSAEQAVATLDNLREIDPVFNFADRVNLDEHMLMMGGSPLGFMNETIAEEYAFNGAYAKALQAYKASRQYPDLAEPLMAKSAIEQEKAEEYLDPLLAFDADEHDTMFMISRLTVALLKDLNGRMALGESFAEKYPAITAKVHPFTAKLADLRHIQASQDSLSERVLRETLGALFTSIGSYDAALEMLGSPSETNIMQVEAFGAILTDMAHRGNYEQAVATYDKLVARYTKVFKFDVHKFNIAVMGWSLVHGQRKIFDRFYNLLPDYRRPRALFSMLETFENQNLQIDDDLAALIMKGENQSRLGETVVLLGRLMLSKNGSAI